jgi:hypothetical protein
MKAPPAGRDTGRSRIRTSSVRRARRETACPGRCRALPSDCQFQPRTGITCPRVPARVPDPVRICTGAASRSRQLSTSAARCPRAGRAHGPLDRCGCAGSMDIVRAAPAGWSRSAHAGGDRCLPTAGVHHEHPSSAIPIDVRGDAAGDPAQGPDRHHRHEFDVAEKGHHLESLARCEGALAADVLGNDQLVRLRDSYSWDQADNSA